MCYMQYWADVNKSTCEYMCRMLRSLLKTRSSIHNMFLTPNTEWLARNPIQLLIPGMQARIISGNSTLEPKNWKTETLSVVRPKVFYKQNHVEGVGRDVAYEKRSTVLLDLPTPKAAQHKTPCCLRRRSVTLPVA